jgi:hypothetical protein
LPAPYIADFWVCSSRQKALHRGRVAGNGRQMEGGAFFDILGLDIGSARDEEIDGGRALFPDGMVERSHPVFVPTVDELGIPGQQVFQAGDVARLGRLVNFTFRFRPADGERGSAG